MALTEERLRSIVESILLLSPEPVPVARLIEVIRIEDPQTEEDEIRSAIQNVAARYADPERPMGRGFRIDEVAGGLQFRTVAENAQYLRRYLSAKPQKLSRAALETLAVIAYRQPVTKPEIEAIRGVDVGGAIKALLDRELIRILGKRDEVGRPVVYGTTKGFLEFFGLRSLAELPTLREYHELDPEHQRLVDAMGEAEPTVAELAEAAGFLMEVPEDPDLDVLDAAVASAEQVKRRTDEVLNPKQPEPVSEQEITEILSAPPEPAPQTVATTDQPTPAEAPAKRKKRKKATEPTSNTEVGTESVASPEESE